MPKHPNNRLADEIDAARRLHELERGIADAAHCEARRSDCQWERAGKLTPAQAARMRAHHAERLRLDLAELRGLRRRLGG